MSRFISGGVNPTAFGLALKAGTPSFHEELFMALELVRLGRLHGHPFTPLTSEPKCTGKVLT